MYNTVQQCIHLHTQASLVIFYYVSETSLWINISASAAFAGSNQFYDPLSYSHGITVSAVRKCQSNKCKQFIKSHKIFVCLAIRKYF